MEEAPLNLARSHARNAILETRKANAIAASEEHDLAAGEFANAAKGTGDREALRTLRLLEQQHLRLAAILKSKPDGSPSTGALQAPELAAEATHEPRKTVPSERSTSVYNAGTTSSQSNPPSRETSSSIASNLATARGIPPSRRRINQQSLPQVSTQTAEGRVVNPQRKSRLGDIESRLSDSAEKARIDLDASTHQDRQSHRGIVGSGLPPPIATASSEEPFSKFYNTFNNLISNLSAPLAFAGLPLSPNEATTPISSTPHPKALEQVQRSQGPRNTLGSRSSADPDLARLFSRAALRAAREENGLGPVAESFYVVPTTGGTMSYAGMLTARQSSNLTDDDPDAEFVDARETPASNSPVQSRYRRQKPGSLHDVAPARRPPSGSTKTWEELHVENDTLKNVVVDLGDRLRAFELGAQKSSLALHASMRQFSSPTASVVPGGKIPPMPGSGAGPLANLGIATRPLEDRIRELEEELKVVKKDNRKLGRENQKYLGVIEKYRERWEALKEGARERVKGGSVGGNPVTEGSSRNGRQGEEL